MLLCMVPKAATRWPAFSPCGRVRVFDKNSTWASTSHKWVTTLEGRTRSMFQHQLSPEYARPVGLMVCQHLKFYGRCCCYCGIGCYVFTDPPISYHCY